MQIIATEDAPRPAGHYVQAIERDGILYVSGQLPVRPDGSHAPDLPFEDQARIALTNLTAILRAAGVPADGLVRVTAYIVGVGNWPAFNRVYAEVIGPHRPARSVVPVPELHYGYLVEVDAIAHLRPTQT